MGKPKTIKSLLKASIQLANAPIDGIPGSGKLTENELKCLYHLVACVQNELGEMSEILEKFELKYQS